MKCSRSKTQLAAQCVSLDTEVMLRPVATVVKIGFHAHKFLKVFIMDQFCSHLSVLQRISAFRAEEFTKLICIFTQIS